MISPRLLGGSWSLLTALLITPPAVAAEPLRVAPGDGCDDVAGTPFCTLAAALRHAEASPGDDVVDLEGRTVTLTSVDHLAEGGNGLPAITTALTLRNGVIERGDAPEVEPFRLLHVAPAGSLHLVGLTVRNGATAHGFDGAGVWNRGELILERCRVEGNRSADDGGGMRNDGRLTVIDSVFADNAAEGRGGTGGALANVPIDGEGTARIERTLFAGNRAEVAGGAVWNQGELTVLHSRFENNRATQYGGAFHNHGRLDLRHVRITGNRAGIQGGGLRAFAPVRLADSQLAGNLAPVAPECRGEIRSGGNNVTGDLDGCRWVEEGP